MTVMEFQGRNCFIVGGSSGIGLSTAKLLTRLGAKVIIFGRDPQKLDRALEEISPNKMSEGQCLAARSLDVADFEGVKKVADDTSIEFGPPDVLINCAGRARPDYFERISMSQFDETMKINLYGVWHSVTAWRAYMQPGGWIVNVSSVAGFIGVFGYTDYCASKFAVIGFSEALRSELAPQGIGVSVLCPPDTDTPGLAVENLTKPPETKAVSGNVKLMSADEVARSLIAGLKKGRFMIIPGRDGRMTFLMKRLFPGLVQWIMDRAVGKSRLPLG